MKGPALATRIAAALLVTLALSAQQESALAVDVEIPTHFDTRTKWYGCGLHVMDQGQCGSCWAVSATSVFGDRACIWLAENGTALPPGGVFTGNRLFQKAGQCTEDLHQAHDHGCKRTALFPSPQALLSCASLAEDKKLFPDSAGCGGGWNSDAWRYMFIHGLPTMEAGGAGGCVPYTSGHCHGKDPHGNGCRSCDGVIDQCEDSGTKPTFYRVHSFGSIHDPELHSRASTAEPRPASDAEALGRQVRAMQVELMTNGPLQVCIDYFGNFGKFFNDSPLGIYNSTDKQPVVGGHCLNLLGWGHDESSQMDYWLVKNSWGPNWGNEGVFRFIRGADLCGIESDIWAGCPANSNCQLTAGVRHNESHVPLGAEDHVLLRERLFDPAISLALAQDAHARDAPPSSASRGGYWREIPRQEFSTHPFALHVAHAYEEAYGAPTTPEQAAAAAVTVRSQGGVRGFKLNVLFENGREVMNDHV
ncbi:Cathepsin B-like cysteine proteinase 5 [Hondaea fermentalgiana]|uniref:Cathepsin B-like cysteine proteinase 5 n=1 Tax=Hondaea fermentalgiana TaxID=2315210 RepID=A0A2R5G4T4_9STRA|nr:Cathepsin B-like cysteine proteinase 5 [Hondaea fermentalgiana]|eukprot:GBG26037.1 Cathepsin B-like cysteine proteinase 5 [Hondaea fermentalgiana]